MIQRNAQISFVVVLCTHNGERYLEQQLLSIAAQSVRPRSLAIHDWNSTDNTVSIVNKVVRLAGDRLDIRLVCHPTANGPKECFVQAIRQSLESCGEDYVLLCDQDDLWHSRKVETFLEYLQGMALDARPAIMFSDVRIVDASGCMIADSFYTGYSPFRPPYICEDPSVLLVNPCIGMTMCVASRFLKDVIDDLDRPWIMHDWGILLLAITRGETVRFVPDRLVDYRQHASNQLGASRRGRVLSRLKKARQHFAALREQLDAIDYDVSPRRIRLIVSASRLQRFFLMLAAVRSRLLFTRDKLLLAVAIALFW